MSIFQRAACLALAISGLTLLPGASAFDEAPALPERAQPGVTRQRALPEHYAAIGAPAWSVEAPQVADSTRQLIDACRAGNHEQIKKLLAAGALANGGDETGQRPLLAAVGSGHVEIVRLLLQRGASPNVKGLRGRTPLGLAAASGEVGIVRLLLAAGADIDARSDNRSTALHEAIRFRHADVVEVLIAAAPYERAHDREGLHPLALAASLGNLPALKALLDAGIDPDLPDRTGLTALYWARRYQKDLAESLLVEKGAQREAWPIALD